MYPERLHRALQPKHAPLLDLLMREVIHMDDFYNVNAHTHPSGLQTTITKPTKAYGAVERADNLN